MALVTVPGVTSARRAVESRVRPVVTPEGTTAETAAVWPMSVRSRSVKVTAMVDVSAVVPVCSARSFWAMTSTTGASFVPVIVMTIVSVSVPGVPLLSAALTV